MSLKAQTSISVNTLLDIARTMPGRLGRKFLARWAHTLQLLHWWLDAYPDATPEHRTRMEKIVLDFHKNAIALYHEAHNLGAGSPLAAELHRIKSDIGRIARQKAIVAAVALQMTIYGIEPQDEAFRRRFLSDKPQRQLRALLRDHVGSPELFRQQAKNMGFLPNGQKKRRRAKTKR